MNCVSLSRGHFRTGVSGRSTVNIANYPHLPKLGFLAHFDPLTCCPDQPAHLRWWSSSRSREAVQDDRKSAVRQQQVQDANDQPGASLVSLGAPEIDHLDEGDARSLILHHPWALAEDAATVSEDSAMRSVTSSAMLRLVTCSMIVPGLPSVHPVGGLEDAADRPDTVLVCACG